MEFENLAHFFSANETHRKQNVDPDLLDRARHFCLPRNVDPLGYKLSEMQGRVLLVDDLSTPLPQGMRGSWVIVLSIQSSVLMFL